MRGYLVAGTVGLVLLSVVAAVGGAIACRYYLSPSIADPHGLLRKIASGKEYAMSYGPNRVEFPCADEHINRIAENALAVKDAFHACREQLSVTFAPFTANEPDLFAIFVTIVASRLGPYGHSTQKHWTKIPKERALNCSQHSIFVSHAIQHFYPEVETVRYGLDGGVIGNHALVAYRRDDFEMVLDGMISLILILPIHKVLEGEPANVFDMFDFYSRTDESVEISRRRIRGALRMGAIRPEHVIYKDIDDLDS